MATAVDDVTITDVRGPVSVAREARFARAELLWTLFGVTLLGSFLAYVLATS